MRDYAKVGGRKGLPGYRTPSVFRYAKHVQAVKLKIHASKSQQIKREQSKSFSK